MEIKIAVSTQLSIKVRFKFLKQRLPIPETPTGTYLSQATQQRLEICSILNKVAESCYKDRLLVNLAFTT